MVGGVGELTLPDLPDAPVKTGWIDRWPDATGDDPLRAVNIGAVLAPLGIGEKHVAAALSDWVPPVPDDIAKTLDALSDDDPHDTRAMGAVREAYRANSNTTPVFGKVVKGAAPGAQTTGSGDAQTLPDDLELVATCVKAGVPSHVYIVSLGDFDTHADERAAHRSLLKALDDALTRFPARDEEQQFRQERRRHGVFGVRTPGSRRTRLRAPTTAPRGRCS